MLNRTTANKTNHPYTIVEKWCKMRVIFVQIFVLNYHCLNIHGVENSLPQCSPVIVSCERSRRSSARQYLSQSVADQGQFLTARSYSVTASREFRSVSSSTQQQSQFYFNFKPRFTYLKHESKMWVDLCGRKRNARSFLKVRQTNRPKTSKGTLYVPML